MAQGLVHRNDAILAVHLFAAARETEQVGQPTELSRNPVRSERAVVGELDIAGEAGRLLRARVHRLLGSEELDVEVQRPREAMVAHLVVFLPHHDAFRDTPLGEPEFVALICPSDQTTDSGREAFGFKAGASVFGNQARLGNRLGQVLLDLELPVHPFPDRVTLRPRSHFTGFLEAEPGVARAAASERSVVELAGLADTELEQPSRLASAPVAVIGRVIPYVHIVRIAGDRSAVLHGNGNAGVGAPA